jgi:hypothetical protein
MGSSTLGYLPYVLEGRSYKVQFANIAAVGAVPSTRVIAAGTGLAGGGDLSENRVISIAPGGVGFDQLALSGVVAGTYGSGSAIPILTVDAKGRVTSATTAALDVTGFVPTSRTITAGDGLTGGGSLASNISLAANFSATTPSALGAASAGIANTVSRGDHVHPAVNLSDATQTQGALPLGRGGTGDALSPVAGAVVYSTGSKFALTSLGGAGQVLVSNGTGAPSWLTLTGTGTVTSVNLTAGTGISVSGGPITAAGSINVVNTAPDQIVSLTGGGLTSITGTYPNFTITSSGGTGTVSSVNASGGTTGLSFTGGPITTSGTLTLGGTLAVANGGTGASVAGTARTNLGAAASGANTDITSIALTTGTISASPVSGTDIVNKLYADSIASGINFHQSVRLATAAALAANTYNNGTSGVGATLTANANGALSVDGVAAVVGNRILVKNEVTQANNGVYTVTQVGSGAAPYILTRATDFDSAGTGVDQIDAGDFFLVTAGSTQSNTSWVQQTPLPIVVGTTAIVFSQFAAPVLYSAGTGLTLAGTVFSITNTGVAASTYGSASSVPVIAFNAQGQATSVTNTSIAIAASQITSGVLPVVNGGTGVTTSTGTGSVVLSSSPTLVTPTLGAASATSITNALGAVGTPSYTFTGDTNTGIYSPAADTIAFVEGGVEAMRIDSSGNVGINQPPNASQGRVQINQPLGSSVDGALRLTDNATTSFVFNNISSGLSALWSSGALAFGTASGTFTERMRIDNSGNVGIGTSSPSAKLHVTNSDVAVGVLFSGATKGVRFGFNSTQTSIFGVDNTGTGTYQPLDIGGSQVIFSTANVEKMRLDSSGNVGIGTSSPLNKLQVNGANVGIRLSDTSGTTDFHEIQSGGVNGQNLFIDADRNNVGSGNMIFRVAGATERLRIASAGQIGIGGANYGTAGQVLTSAGPSAAPSWQPASGGLSRAQVTAISMILGF